MTPTKPLVMSETIGFVLNSGILSVTAWASLFACLAVAIAWWRQRPTGKRVGPALPPLLGSNAFLIVFGVCSAFGFSFGLYKSYTNPRDLMQDIVSAQEFLAGRSLYPERMNELMREALAAEPARPSPVWFSGSLRSREADSREETFREHWVQAHPPLSTLLVTPFVATTGVLGTQMAILLLSLAALVLTGRLISRGLELRLSRRHLLLIALACLGAEPLIVALRSGQLSLLIGVLLTVAWYSLRRGRPVLAGVAIALATGLKLFAGLLLVYLLLRHRRAFASAVASLVLLFALTVLLTGWQSQGEFVATSREVVAEYQGYVGNVSLLSLLARTAGPEKSEAARATFLAVGI